MTLSRRQLAGATLATALVLGTGLPAAAEAVTRTVTAGGVPYWTEVSGSGEPLLILHGGLGSFHMFDPVLADLGKGRTVIGVDLYGHGHTPLTDRPWDYAAVADDMAAVLAELGHPQVDVLGYSMGAGVAFQLAARHPETVRRVVLVSGPFATEGMYAEIRAMQVQVGSGMAEAMKGTPMFDGYMAIAPRPEDFPRLLDAMGDLMRTQYDWRDQVALLTMPVMIVIGDADMVSPAHAVEFFNLLGGGKADGGWMRENVTQNRLAILPGRTHYEMGVAPELAPTVRPFLDGSEPTPVWTEN